jgi:hypothetical protein
MERRRAIAEHIRAAFASTPRPAATDLRNSDESDEPFLLEEEFKDKADWRALDAAFLDQAPDGFGSALSFFSSAAFRFFLPGYLVADLAGELERVDPVFHLWHGLDDTTGAQRVNPRRYGEKTWSQVVAERFASFTRPEIEAIVEYLEYKASVDELSRARIGQALANYWRPRSRAE